jgi:hypothetical protein
LFKNKYLRLVGWAVLWAGAMAPALAEVVRIDIVKREDLLGGRSHGDAGVYEWIEGRAHFTLDPLHKNNDAIVDLKLAPRNAQGLAEFAADIGMLRPKLPARANGVVIFDVVNRGRHTVLEYLNRGDRTAPPAGEAFIGDDFLLKQGATIVWLGWQQDLPPLDGYLRMTGPRVSGVTGRVYGEFSVASRVADVSLGDRL